MYWYTVGHPISPILNFELGTMYYLISADISCAIPNSELGYHVLSHIPSRDIIYHPKF